MRDGSLPVPYLHGWIYLLESESNSSPEQAELTSTELDFIAIHRLHSIKAYWASY
jgi:hypothetical protein